MATRINLKHDAETRAKIQTSQLINRLQSYANGEEGVEIDQGRLKAIEILLRKSLPDLSSVSIEGTGQDGAIKSEVVFRWMREQNDEK